jgi:hypothetical protein
MEEEASSELRAEEESSREELIKVDIPERGAYSSIK